jgi:hypothetical protein
MTVNKAFGFGYCLVIVAADQRFKSNEVPIRPMIYARYPVIGLLRVSNRQQEALLCPMNVMDRHHRNQCSGICDLPF